MNIRVEITFITVGKTISFSKEEILNDVVIGKQMISSNTSINYGVMSGYGNISLIDKKDYENSVRKLMQLNTIASDKIITSVYIDDKLICKYNTEIDIDFLTNTLYVELVDNIVLWENVLVSYTFLELYRVYQSTYISGYSLYNLLKGLSTSETFEPLSTETDLRLRNIRFYLPNFPKDSLLSLWNSFCNATQCHLFRNGKGNIVLEYGDVT